MGTWASLRAALAAPRPGDPLAGGRVPRRAGAPGVAHCAGGAGPQPQGLFDALVVWVENKVPPKTIASQVVTGGVVTRTRPLCPYPRTAVYKGSGSTDDAANFTCGGNLETRDVVCDSVLVKYKHEVQGPLDHRAGGTTPAECRVPRPWGHGH
ncbi:MAG: tannase/feruloyl esterase family alpha/beta hydrolase [Rubrivivax sp.]|nr:tannase/feruloyl esterase family alpha/beta hydrolase [Rubrivivax sp.]